MLRSLSALALSSLVIAAGCGPDMSGGAGGGAGQAPGGEPPTPGAQSGAGSAEEAIRRCEQSVESAPQLSRDVKADLEKVCRKAATGDERAVRDATRRVCEEIVEQSVPEGPAREQARSSCRQGP